MRAARRPPDLSGPVRGDPHDSRTSWGRSPSPAGGRAPSSATIRRGARRTRGAGLEYQEADGQVFWGKSGARYGYSAFIGGTRDLSRTLVYSVNSTDAKGTARNPVADAITAAALR